MRVALTLAATAVAALALTAGCGSSSSSPPPCDVAHQTGCAAGQYCETVGTGSGCFAPVIVRGTVVDPAGPTSLSGARIVALDANRAPMSTVATSTLGTWELAVHAAREASGKPLSSSFTLRADAQDHQTFPGGIRPALPIDPATATTVSPGHYVLSGPLTALELLPLPAGTRSAIHGTVASPPSRVAPLVVAEPVAGGAGQTAIADLDGGYTIFNLTPDASYAVTAFAQGVNYTGAVTPLLDPGTDTTVVRLAIAGTASATFGGNIIANNSPNPTFQVTLVLDSTYSTTLDRGESPPGLTVAGAFGNPGYTFTGVPDGTYRVLAAFGKDGDVRDVSGTGNTASPRVTVAGGAVQGTPPGFKIIPAVELQQIGGVDVGVAPITVVPTATPVFSWVTRSAYSNYAIYRVQVFDAFGELAWTRDVTTSAPLTYGTGGSAAQALVPDRPYLVRIIAYDNSSSELSRTEDVVGVFMVQP